MSKVYVANASPQNHEFQYRIPEVNKTRKITIPQMKQVVLPDDMSAEQISAVVSQHEVYGFVSSDDVKNGKTRKSHTRLVYSIDRPVSSLIIDALYQNNYKILDASGKDTRKTMAIAANNAVLQKLEEERQQSGIEADVSGFQITIQEEDQVSVRGEPLSSEQMAEGYIVQDNEAPVQNTVRPTRAKRK